MFLAKWSKTIELIYLFYFYQKEGLRKENKENNCGWGQVKNLLS